MDLAEIQLPNALLGASTSGSLYVAWIALSYARVYDKPISDVLSTPWDDIVPTLFDGLHDGAQIVSALPASPPLLLTEEVKTAIRLGDGHWFVDRLRENSVDAWPVKVPLRAYYADNDVDVIPKDVTIFAVRARQTNQDRFPFEAISVGEFDHDGSVLEAAPAVVAWFNSLAREAEPVSVRTDTVRTDTHN